ncbi:Caroteno-chlorophyll a-c-binding protein [Symbiodinium microadriaticum]|uniref:Caroteno-chlorophyll a-c-binding protein n=1 Tax=Symbiodinium microadriaticum TaxID=2951 RepID=A0A1Q9DM11_SYMMI|nr:Caroteno-chlorophyll a-c-binding protein [Symbiodinium microadriaticum]
MVSAEAAHGETLTVEEFRHRAQLALGVGIKALVSGDHILPDKATVSSTGLRHGDTVFATARRAKLVATRQRCRMFQGAGHDGGAFALIRSNGTVRTWGDEAFGGDSSTVQEKLTNVEDVCATCGAFAALRADGSVVCWGNISLDAIEEGELREVRSLCASSLAMAAVRKDGSVVTWGQGPSSVSRGLGMTDVQQIAATDGAFAAVLGNGRVVAWGFEPFGANTEPVENELVHVRQVVGAGFAFGAVREDGTVVTWGVEDRGGNCEHVRGELRQVERLYSNYFAFAALRSDGTVVTWGLAGFGSDSSMVKEELRDVRSIGSTAAAFAAVRGDGHVVTWGSPGLGGNSTSVQSELRGVRQVVGTAGSFAALRDDGTVVTWGASNGGDSSHVQHQLTNVESIAATAQSFAAVRSDEVVVTWGSHGHVRQTETELFQDLIHDQPADPWGYIDKRSAEARGEAELAAKAEAERKLAQADLEDIRQRTATQLQQAAEDGSLENALSHSQEAPELPPMSKELEEITDSQEVAHMKTEEEDLDNLRLKTQAALFRAAEDGSLQEVLGSKASQPAAAATAKDVDVLRLHAAQMLLSAAEDGSLEKALIDASKDTKDVDLLRQEAAATLLRAAEDGTLESVLSKNQAPKDDLESLRQEAAHTLLAAAQDGRLEEVLTKKSQVGDSTAMVQGSSDFQIHASPIFSLVVAAMPPVQSRFAAASLVAGLAASAFVAPSTRGDRQLRAGGASKVPARTPVAQQKTGDGLAALAILGAGLAAVRGSRTQVNAAAAVEAPEPPLFQPSEQFGATEPVGFFDPLGFTKVGDEKGFRKLRVSEIKHGRVAMMASIGLVAQHFVKFPFFENAPAGFSIMDKGEGVLGFFGIFLARSLSSEMKGYRLDRMLEATDGD